MIRQTIKNIALGSYITKQYAGPLQNAIKFEFSAKDDKFFQFIDFEPKYLERIPWIFKPLTPIISTLKQYIISFQQFVGLPWWAVIMLSSLFIRATIFPLIFVQMKKISKMGPVWPVLAHVKESFKDSNLPIHKRIISAIQIYRSLCKQEKVRMSTIFIYNMFYYPFLITMIYSLRGLLAIDAVSQTSFLHLQNLGDIDPYYIFPTLTIALYYYNFQRYITKENRNTIISKIRITCQYLLIIFYPFLCCWPAGLTLYMFTNALVSVIQGTITKSMYFQKLINPKILYYSHVLSTVQYDKGTSDSIIEGIKTAEESWKEKSIKQQQLVTQTEEMLKKLDKQMKKENQQKQMKS